MQGIESLSDEELLKLSQPSKPSGGIESLSDEELMAMVGKQQAPAQADPGHYDDASSLIQTMMAAGSGAAGVRKGLADFLSGAGRLGAKGLEALTGADIESKVPQFQPSQTEQMLMQASPTAAGIGEFAGGSLPLAALPEAAAGEMASLAPMIEKLPASMRGLAGLTGRGAKGAAVGSALAPVYSPDEDIRSSLETGGALGLAGSMLGPMAGGLSRSIGKALGMGGTASAEKVKGVMDAADRLDVNLPLAETIDSRAVNKLQKIGLKNIPGSGMSQEYTNLTGGLTDQINGLMQKLNPENEHAGESTKNFLSQKYGSLKDQVQDMYSDVQNSVEMSAPGDIHKTDELFSQADSIKKEISKSEKLPGGKIKVPSSVRDFIGDVKKEKVGLDDAFRQDEIINEYIGDAKAKAATGDKEGNRELRYFNKLKEANLNDVDSTIKSVDSPEISEKWRDAKEFYKDNLVPFERKSSTLRKIVRPGTRGDEVQSMFLRTSGQQPKAQILSEVSDQLPQEIKDQLAHNYLAGPKDESPLKVIDKYEKLQPKQRDLLFSPEDKQKLDDLLTMKKHVGSKEFNQMFVADTGSQSPALAVPAAIYAAGHAFGGPFGGLAALGGAAAGGRGLKEALMSDALKKMYLKSLKASQITSPELGRSSYLGIPTSGGKRE
jgi:hypothetical protein